jgi:hypothetical protein
MRAIPQLTDNGAVKQRCEQVSARFDVSDPMRPLCARLEALAGEPNHAVEQARDAHSGREAE